MRHAANGRELFGTLRAFSGVGQALAAAQSAHSHLEFAE
jgi:hypothetical protein